MQFTPLRSRTWTRVSSGRKEAGELLTGAILSDPLPEVVTVPTIEATTQALATRYAEPDTSEYEGSIGHPHLQHHLPSLKRTVPE